MLSDPILSEVHRVSIADVGLVVILAGAAAPLVATAYLDGPVPAKTGGFGEMTCQQCHWDNPLNDPAGRLTLSGVPVMYTPGDRYLITVSVAHPELVLGGFQLSARFDRGPGLGASAGMLRPTNDLTQQVADEPGRVHYIQHTRAGTSRQEPGAAEWTFEWTAPSEAEGVTFHAAGNASNGDASQLGDFIYTTASSSRPADARAAEARAVAYLSTEVPHWRREHPCYSCHNNGDAARALVAAAARRHSVGNAIDDTLAWLATPERWDSNAQRGVSEDLPLARIQFASALASMVTAGRTTPDALDRASALLVVHQKDDGSWRLSESQVLGGATFYGTALATAMARRALARARTDAVRGPLAKADAWLRTTIPAAVLDASSVLLGLERDVDPEAVAQRRRALDVLKRGRGQDGGWGPYITSQSEPFDTALAVLALVEVRNADALPATPYSDRDLGEAIDRAREYLVGTQNPDGSWPERPTERAMRGASRPPPGRC